MNLESKRNKMIKRDRKVRRDKKAERYRKFFKKRKEWNRLIKENGSDILDSENFRSTRNFMQHGTMSVNRHSLDVAIYSIALSKKLRIRCSQRDLIRGALLHDYFLYDWHDKTRRDYKPLHGFYHPQIALRNASEEYRLTPRQRDIIGKHMWPLTVVPPMCREAWIVTAADKYCSFMETVRLHNGQKKKRERRIKVKNRTQKKQNETQEAGEKQLRTVSKEAEGGNI